MQFENLKKKPYTTGIMMTTWQMDDVETFVTATQLKLAQLEHRIEIAEARADRAERLVHSVLDSMDELRQKVDAFEAQYKRELKNFKARIYRLVRKYREYAETVVT